MKKIVFILLVLAVTSCDKLLTQYPHNAKTVDKMTEAASNVTNKKEEKIGNVILEAKLFIEGNYSKDISLDDVANSVERRRSSGTAAGKHTGPRPDGA